MRGIRSLGLCVAAVLALCGLLAASAGAETLPTPVWASCAKASPKNTGKYKNKTCTEKEEAGKGAYEIVAGVGKEKGFKGKTVKGSSVALIVKFWEGIDKIECASGKDSGTPVAPNLEEKVTASFSKCTVFKTNVCTSPGAKKGEIKVSDMKGVLEWVEERKGSTEAEKEAKTGKAVIGLKLESEASPGGLISEFNCENGFLEGKVTGELIGEQTGDTNVASKESGAVDLPGPYYGEHEFETKTYVPTVNLIGSYEEQPEIEECEALRNNCEETHPAHVLKAEFCGTFVEKALGAKCTPPTYVGLEDKFVNKGEALMVKA